MTNLEHIRVVARDSGDFEVIFEPSGAVLLTSQNVSVETLVRLADATFPAEETEKSCGCRTKKEEV